MVLFINKHIEVINDALHRTGEGKGDSSTYKPKPIPVPTAEGSSKDKEPVECAVDEEEGDVVVGGREGHSLCLEIESHALVEAVGDRPDDIVPSIGSGNCADIGREAHEE